MLCGHVRETSRKDNGETPFIHPAGRNMDLMAGAGAVMLNYRVILKLEATCVVEQQERGARVSANFVEQP